MSAMWVLADQVSPPKLTWNWQVPMWPSVSGWALAGVMVLAVAAIVWLYRAQRKIVSGWTVAALTAIRIALLLMIFVLMLRPALQWTRTTSSAGTLWLLLDNSQSMAMTDPQTTAVERLRWADALGYLPQGGRGSKLDVYAARLMALGEKLKQLRPALTRTEGPEESEAEKAEVAGLAKGLEQWQKEVGEVATLVERDKAVKESGSDLGKKVRRIVEMASEGSDKAKRAERLRQAEGEVAWAALQTNVQLCINEMRQMGDRADNEYLTRHASNAGVQNGMAQLVGRSRAELAYLTLSTRSVHGLQSLTELLPQYRTKVVTVAEGAQALGQLDNLQTEETLKAALSPGGKATNLSAGLQLIAEQIGAEENASVVIVSDGRQNVPGDAAEVARLLAARGVRVNALLVGASQVSPDAAVDQIDAPDWIFKDDTVKATALVRLDGLPGKELKVELRRGGELIGGQTQTIRATSGQETKLVQFTDKPPEAGAYEYEVRVSEAAGEVNLENNRQNFRVAVKKDKLWALLVEDKARWEYQFLVNYMDLDQRLKLQSVLLDPARIENVAFPPAVKASPANTQREAQILPATREEWNAFDLVVLGDVPPESLSNAQQQMIAAAVRDRGMTLVIVAGARNMPGRYANTPLAELLPVQMTGDWEPELMMRHLRGGFRPAVAPEGTTSVLAQMGLDSESNSLLWSKMPRWYWHATQTVAKPGASVIWSIEEPEDVVSKGEGKDGVGTIASSRRRALLAVQSVGLGRVLFLGGDQTWRMRQVGGENLQERFWGQVLRWAVGSDLPAGGKFVRFGTNRPRYAAGDPIVVTARILREDLTPYSGLSFEATATLRTGQGAATESREVDRAKMTESPAAPGYYTATLSGVPAGAIDISVRGAEVDRLLRDDPSVTSKTLAIQVLPRMNTEQRNMNTDRNTLTRITQAGGGVMLDGPYQDVLASYLPKLEQTHSTTEQVGFFTDPRDHNTWWTHLTFMVIFIGLITAEWIVRKWGGLV